MKPPQTRSRNILLNLLSDEDFACLEPHLERVRFQEGQTILSSSEQIAALFFPEAGVASFHDILADGSRIGIGIVGYEGLTGWPVLLGSGQSPHEVTVAIGGGTAMRVDAHHLTSTCLERPALNNLLLRFVQSFVTQMARTIASNLTDSVDRRLARWLVMNRDRLDVDEIDLTHEQIGVMLGVRRASVTDAVHILEGLGTIRGKRGRITIRDRGQLRQLAGQSYGVAEAEYSRLIAPFPNGV